MPKRYYWLKLKEDFFDEDTIEWLEEQENGLEYSHFYLKLCLKSLRTNGELIRSVGNIFIPYDAKKLSEITKTDIDTVKVAMDLFKKIGLIDILDGGVIKLNQLSELVGSETDKAAIMRRKRTSEQEGNKIEQSGNNVTVMLPQRELERDIDIETEKEKENNPEADDESVVDGFEVISKTYLDRGLSFQYFKIEQHCKIYGVDAVNECLKAFVEVDLNTINKSPEAYFIGMLKNYIPGIKITPKHVIVQQETEKKLDELREAGEKVKGNKLTPEQVEELTGKIKGITEKSNFLNGGAKQQEDHPWGVKE